MSQVEWVEAPEVEELFSLLSPSERVEMEFLLHELPDRWDLSRILFDKQHAFVADPSENKTAVCSRRAGKSVGCAAELLDSNKQRPKAPSLYFTLTRGSGKRIIWSTLLHLNRRYGLGYEPNESELVLKKGGEGRIYLTGADTKGEIEKWRGVPWGKAVGDEAQALPAFLKEAVEEVLEPAFMDYNGTLSLIGTPAPVPVGYFYECCNNPGWSHHSWTFFDNPWIEKNSGRPHQAHLERALRTRGVTVEDPSIQREFFGRWVYDPNALVFRFDKDKNVFHELPDRDARGRGFVKPWEFVLGVDLGYEDADAIAVIAFNDASPNAYLVEEFVETKQTITQLTEKLQELVRKYSPLSIVVDTGGLGKKIAQEVAARTSLPLKAAEKARKFEYIELLNDAMRSGRFFVRPGSRFSQDSLLVEWDREKSRADRLVISDRFHSDIGDAVLYAFRESLHWLHEPPPPPPPAPGTPEWLDEQERQMEEQAERELAERNGTDDEGWGGGW